MGKDLLNFMRSKSDLYLINIVNQKDNNDKELYEAAMSIYKERGLNEVKAASVLQERKSTVTELRELLLKGESKGNISQFLTVEGVPENQIEHMISTNYNKMEMDLNDDFKSRRRYYIYVIFWIFVFSIILLFTVERYLGDSTLMLNFLLTIPFFYLRFKPIFKLRALRVANHEHNYKVPTRG